jgi:GT2 family glycosyltransferase
VAAVSGLASTCSDPLVFWNAEAAPMDLAGAPYSGPLLSIIIPTHNRADLLRECLDSVTAHAPAGVEIIVVEDGARVDLSPTLARFAGVRRVRLTRRRGFCAAVNIGIAWAQAPIVELLNDDALATPGWVNAALPAFADPGVAAVAPLVLRSDGRVDSAGDRYDPGGFAEKIGHGERLSARHLIRRPVFGASASSAFYRRDWLMRVGGFPESFGAYFDDVDVACRLRRAGGRTVFEPASRVIHRGGASHGRPTRRLIEQQSCNEERLYWRNRRGWSTLPRHVAVVGAKAARRWSEGRLLPWLTGRARAWLELALGLTKPATPN